MIQEGGVEWISKKAKKKNSLKNPFLDNVEWIPKNLGCFISADAKDNVKKEEIKDLVVVSFL